MSTTLSTANFYKCLEVGYRPTTNWNSEGKRKRKTTRW